MLEKIKKILDISPIRISSFLIMTIFLITGLISFNLNTTEVIILLFIYSIIGIFILYDKPFKKVVPIFVILFTTVIASYLSTFLEQFSKDLSNLSMHRTFLLAFFVLFVILTIGYNENDKQGKWISGFSGVIIYSVILLRITVNIKNELILYSVSVITGILIPILLERGVKFVLSFRNKK